MQQGCDILVGRECLHKKGRNADGIQESHTALDLIIGQGAKRADLVLGWCIQCGLSARCTEFW